MSSNSEVLRGDESQTAAQRRPSAGGSRDSRGVEQRWLDMQCSMLQDVYSGLLLKSNKDFTQAEVVASWPAETFPSADLLLKALACAKEQEAVSEVVSVGAGGVASGIRLLTPIVVGDWNFVLVLDVASRSVAEQKSLQSLLGWNSEWLRFASLSVPRSDQRDFVESFSLCVAVLEQKSFTATASTLVAELSARYQCVRASLGLRKGKRTHVEVVSHSARFRQESNVIREIAAAMDEAIDQDRTVLHPTSEQATVITQAHKQLLARAGGGSACTFPIAEGGKIIGALTLEREDARIFTHGDLEQVEQVLALVAPTLWLRYDTERPLPIKVAKSASAFAGRLFGAEHVRLKLAALAGVSLLAFGFFAQGDWRVTADAVIEGQVQRTIAAPIDGYIASSDARPGDRVSSGQLIGALDDSDLRLERLKWSTLRQQMVSELREARAQNSRAEVGIIAAKIEQADAELELVDEQLSRTRLKAPFDGVVIEGDLSQLLGTPVKRGEPLFKIAPLGDYRIVLRVDEQDIVPVEPGMSGRLILTSLPDSPVELEVTRLTPVSTTGEGRNYFRVEAIPVGSNLQLQPGMEGVGKVTVGEAPLAWIWSRELLTWLRLQTWTWWR